MPKKSFVLYMDQYDPIKKLTMEQRGELLTAIFSYHAEEEYKIKDPLVDMAFSFFEQTFKRDCEKWKRSAGRSRENGKKGGRPKGSKNKALYENPENPVGLLETQKNPGEPKKPVSVSVSVSESVSASVSASEKKEKNIADSEKKKFSKDVINKLNELTGKNFRHTETNIGFIKARLNQDPNLVMEDFEKVIKVKMKDDYFIENNGKYLRPQTLFGTKFDTYLNECIDLKVTKKPDNNQLGAAYQEWNGGKL